MKVKNLTKADWLELTAKVQAEFARNGDEEMVRFCAMFTLELLKRPSN